MLTLWIGRIPLWVSAIIAVGRGAGQLALVSLLLGVALTQSWAGIVLLAVMLTTAIITATGRLREFPGALLSIAILSGMTVTLGIVFGTGAFDFSIR